MKKKILILANSSSGLYDFRNELVTALLSQYNVAVSLPDTQKTSFKNICRAGKIHLYQNLYHFTYTVRNTAAYNYNKFPDK